MLVKDNLTVCPTFTNSSPRNGTWNGQLLILKPLLFRAAFTDSLDIWNFTCLNVQLLPVESYFTWLRESRLNYLQQLTAIISLSSSPWNLLRNISWKCESLFWCHVFNSLLDLGNLNHFNVWLDEFDCWITGYNNEYNNKFSFLLSLLLFNVNIFSHERHFFFLQKNERSKRCLMILIYTHTGFQIIMSFCQWGSPFPSKR